MLSETGKSGSGCPISSNEIKTEAKSFTLSDEEDMTSRPCIIVEPAALPRFISCLVIFQNFWDPI